jgi:hypothetical protein
VPAERSRRDGTFDSHGLEALAFHSRSEQLENVCTYLYCLMIQCVRHGSCKGAIGRFNRSFPCSLSRSCSRTGGTISTRPMWRTGCLSWHVASLCRGAPTHAGSAGWRMQRLSLSHMLTSGLSLQLSGAGEPAKSRRWRGTRTTWVLSERAPFDPHHRLDAPVLPGMRAPRRLSMPEISGNYRSEPILHRR